MNSPFWAEVPLIHAALQFLALCQALVPTCFFSLGDYFTIIPHKYTSVEFFPHLPTYP